MAGREQTMGSLRTRTCIAELVRALEGRCAVEVDRRDDYAMVRAMSTGAISMYAHADRVAIAVAPERGYALEGRKPFHRQIPQTRLSTYVIVTAHELRKHFGAVLDLAVESLEWRAHGEEAGVCIQCGVGCGRQVDACPNCWTEVDESGGCLCHGGHPHALRAG